MPLPYSELSRVLQLSAQWAEHDFRPLVDDYNLVMRVASADPPAVLPVVTVPVAQLSMGLIRPGYETGDTFA